MKHNLKITIILMVMFIITQIIGIFIIGAYQSEEVKLPYGMEPPKTETPSLLTGLTSMIFAFAIAIILFFILTRINAETLIRLWFFTVVIIALAITFNIIIFKLNLPYNSILALALAIPLSYLKIFKRNLIVHNLTEFLIYPGIGVVFVLFLMNFLGNSVVLGIIILLLLISLYDIWAVWHSEFMQKMAKYQINNLKFFTGFFVPYAGKKQRLKIKEIKEQYANKSDEALEKQFKKARIKISLAILGGGDIIFPIITAGIFYKTLGLASALIISTSATLALLFLFILARKGKFYPAMPFLTIGMYLGMMVSWLIF